MYKIVCFQVLSEKFKVGKTTVSDILRRKSSYTEAWEKNASRNKFRFGNACRYDRLNDLVWSWFSSIRAKNLPISGPIIQEKASKFAVDLGLTDFKASNGWLESWKSRHSVKGLKVSGESAGVDPATVDDYKKRLPSITSGFRSTDIFNCDETGLYYRALPDRTLAAKGDNAKGTKVSKDRVTLMFACSATGEKLRPLVIGKSANPRCLKNVKRDSLGVTYVANKKGWMTTAIFTDWVRAINADMKRQKRNIILFLDNASSHGQGLNLSNVTLSFLPPNTTSHLQPLDQGIIRAFKALYRKNLLRSLLSKMDSSEDVTSLCRSVTLLDAIRWAVTAWRDVKTTTIQRCFEGAGFLPTPTAQPADDSDDDDDDDVPIAVLVQQFRFRLEDLVSLDDELETDATDESWEDDLIASYRPSEVTEDDGDADECTDAVLAPEAESDLTLEEILSFSSRLRTFSLQKNVAFLEIAETIQTLSEKTIVRARCETKQRSIVDFFSAAKTYV